MTIKEAILKQTKTNPKQNLNNAEIETFLNSLLYYDDERREERTGMHGSAVIVTEDKFCYREQVLSFFFRASEKYIVPKVKRIFLEGWSVHEKWQNLFKHVGIAVGIEQRGHSEEYDLFFTPDAIIEIKGKKYVVEIKSVNDYQFRNMTCHPSAEKQLQLYMHFLGIPKGFVLCENKNTQDIKVFVYDYDCKKVVPYLKRMVKVLKYKKRFEKRGKLPARICDKNSCPRAADCNYADACFNKRTPLNKKEYKAMKAQWENLKGE